MTIKIGDLVPNVNILFREGDKRPEQGTCPIGGEFVAKSTRELFAGKRVIIFSLPGAYTPTCSTYQLPGFDEKYQTFQDNGIDEIYVVSVNDPFVMDSWIKSYDEKQINYFADSNADLMEKSGFSLDLSVIGLGMRLSRFVMIIDNCVVKEIFDENGGGLEKSKAEAILESI